jgi:hypothetical protein
MDWEILPEAAPQLYFQESFAPAYGTSHEAQTPAKIGGEPAALRPSGRRAGESHSNDKLLGGRTDVAASPHLFRSHFCRLRKIVFGKVWW